MPQETNINIIVYSNRIMKITNSGLEGVVLPPNLYKDIKGRFKGQGAVYILYGKKDGKNALYIGKSGRINSRIRRYVGGEIWQKIIIFTRRIKDNPLGETEISDLESRLIKQAKKINKKKDESTRYEIIDDQRQPRKAAISESTKIDVRTFYNQILLISSVIGISAFEEDEQKPLSSDDKQPTSTDTIPKKTGIYEASGKGWHATGYYRTNKDNKTVFVIKKGSTASPNKGPTKRWEIEKNRLLDNGVLTEKADHYLFNKDYEISRGVKLKEKAIRLLSGDEDFGVEKWKCK